MRNIIGKIGEDIACTFLQRKGFDVLERNYFKKWGEIDIIAKKEGKLHFIEVKTVSCENIDSISRETDTYRPEENVHEQKLKRLARTIQSYLLEKREGESGWQFDVAGVFYDKKNRKAKVRLISDVVL
jgi:putative endonuclease